MELGLVTVCLRKFNDFMCVECIEKDPAHGEPRLSVVMRILLLGVIMTCLYSPLDTCISLDPHNNVGGDRATAISSIGWNRGSPRLMDSLQTPP